MFGWFQTRRRNELRKLLYQNTVAAEFLVAFFETAGEAATAARVRALKAETQRLAHDSADRALSAAEVRTLAEINIELRRLHDESADWKTFDDAFAPFGGWEAYYKRHDPPSP